jgi:AdoMet-dependent heme synthase
VIQQMPEIVARSEAVQWSVFFTVGFSFSDGLNRPAIGVNDGDGFAFISHTGDVFPSGFLPVSAGNVRDTPFSTIYRNSPLFRELRDPGLLKGRCGACEFRSVCGGSRARAYAVTGDHLEAEPSCVHQPDNARASASLRTAVS